MLRKPRPMSQPRAAQTLAKDLGADPFSGDVLVGLHLHLKRQVHLERVVDIQLVPLSGL